MVRIKAGVAVAMIIAMMAITTSISIKLKARLACRSKNGE
jgi:hypothetical protein